MKTEDLIGLCVPLFFMMFVWIESRKQARAYEAMPQWGKAGSLFFLLTLIIGSLTPLLMSSIFSSTYSAFNLSHLGLLGIPFGVLATTFVGYWWHRAEHHFDWIWLATHQLHHSPVRVDILGAFYTHPLEVFIKVALGTSISTFVLGLSPLAASITGLIGAMISMFQHTNLRTPILLGYFLPRPESHALHHERDIHMSNYSDLPLWDILFGTFRNPIAFDGKVGFSREASTKIMDMLLMKNVNR